MIRADGSFDHVAAALAVSPEPIADVVILGRGRDGSLRLVTSFPEGNQAPLTQLLVEALVHLGQPGGACLYQGRETLLGVAIARMKDI